MNLIEARGRDFDLIAGRHYTETGWCPSWGNPEIYQFFLPRLLPGQRILDLGSGGGRNIHRLHFAGAEVVGVDNSGLVVEREKELRQKDGLEYFVFNADAWSCLEKYGREFDYIFAIDLLLHQRKGRAISRLGELVAAMKKGAFLYVNVPSTASGEYEYVSMMAKEIEPSTFELECGCTGEPRWEPVCFFVPGELEFHLARLGTGIRFSNTGGETVGGPVKSCVITEKI